ncbi:UDP-3-O-(3-hydroxymyristoyl)glucosamine N-acyltransferase [Spartinivicinus poritis]|uniref:UDP-3-O-acylglucosamine N-acyltransferase n=1 Tax=Spartinivicinus poritis TaxID=2994640 RepID=A0ABT5U1Y8_9GAMM|nr:UDP-3-O-(3-hydroxymyristoyl)glucosamine N-acyltransferase [Spartinivicinus sp. A2-2]MDE1460390.1 UDP-3-O-(3-hydroxymyristoyl)glucosamine N-acyltransferase [Spartinivicinus sp. A2-2]
MASERTFSLQVIADHLEAELQGDPSYLISGIATLQQATSRDLSFLANPTYKKYLPDSQAGAILLAPDEADDFEGNALVLNNPYLGYAKISHWFSVQAQPAGYVHPSAAIAKTAKIAKTASIGANAVVEADAIIGENVVVGAGTVIGHTSEIGADSYLAANVTVCHGVLVGERVTIHSGAVIGADGFGFAHYNNEWHKIAQLGGVVIGSDAEIGANTTIDRGALDNTVIGCGVKLDNLIQIAHNVVIGDNTAVAGCVGISGSTKVGKNCTIAGGSGLAGHLTIADNVHITAMALVTKSIREPGSYSSGAGSSMPTAEWKKLVVRYRQLDKLAKRIKTLEQQLSAGA